MSEINTANVGKETQVGAFLVRGGALDVDYCYDDEKKELEILTEIPLIISNKKPEKETGTDIIMNRNQEYHITLENVNLTDETHRGGVRIRNGKAVITLRGINFIRGGINLTNAESAQLEITKESGGFTHVCGIGGTYKEILINGGNIKAVGGAYAAGIGGGLREGAGNITINGGTLEAIGTGWGNSNGIGCGQWGSGGTITINGGHVRAFGGSTGGSNPPLPKVCGIGGDNVHILVNGGVVEGYGNNGGSDFGGIFRTAPDGNARVAGSIEDTLDKENWNGIINDEVMGRVILGEDTYIDRLTVAKDAELLIPGGMILVNYGTLVNYGKITVWDNPGIPSKSCICNKGEIRNSGVIDGWNENGSVQTV